MYAWKLSTVIFIMIVVVWIWGSLEHLILRSRKREEKKLWIMLNVIGLFMAVYGVVSYTVLGRTVSDDHIFTFAAEYGPEFWREMLMNAFLYFPFGLTLTALIGPWSILIGLIFSVVIELWQYLTGTGIAQGTDVIMNTFGCLIGAVPCLIVFLKKK